MEDKVVKVSGTIVLYRGKPEIKIDAVSQVQVVGDP